MRVRTVMGKRTNTLFSVSSPSFYSEKVFHLWKTFKTVVNFLMSGPPNKFTPRSDSAKNCSISRILQASASRLNIKFMTGKSDIGVFESVQKKKTKKKGTKINFLLKRTWKHNLGLQGFI